MSRRTLQAIGFALLCGLAFAAVWVVAFHTAQGRHIDLRTQVDLATRVYYRPHATDALNALAVLCNAVPYAALSALVLLVAYARLGARSTAILAGTILVPNVVAQVLKTALASDRDGTRYVAHISAAAWPSGHATASLVLVGCAVIVAPGVLRPLVAGAGAVFCLLMAIAVVGLGWHYPSDVVGGWALAGMFLAAAYVLVPDPGPARSAAGLPERFFGAVGAPRQDEQQV